MSGKVPALTADERRELVARVMGRANDYVERYGGKVDRGFLRVDVYDVPCPYCKQSVGKDCVIVRGPLAGEMVGSRMDWDTGFAIEPEEEKFHDSRWNALKAAESEIKSEIDEWVAAR